MWVRFLLMFAAMALTGISLGAAEPARKEVVVIPAREEVDRPLHFIIRRGLKEAIDRKADVVVLDMKTPGGALNVTFDIMEALGKFPGETITFINDEALSAGAFISATTDEIWFAPAGVIGAAAPVLATGGEIDESMKQKVVSYLKARVRATSEGRGYRGQVISAMIDSNFELKIGDRVIKPKGELLSLTAREASEAYGDPPAPLLAAGTAASVEEMLEKKFGSDRFTLTRLEVTWSEHLAVFLRAIMPLLVGAGLLSLYIEFKTPGFGVFGVTGIVLLLVVFGSNYVAGLSGHEPMLVFLLGFLLVMVELFFFPGLVITAVTGVALMLVSLVWSMADLWPNEPISFSGDVFVRPLGSVGLGIVVAIVLALALARFIPKGWFFERLAVTQSIAGSAQVAGGAPGVAEEIDSLVGRTGVAATGLYPSGQVEIDGRRYEGRVAVGTIPAGTKIVVRSRSDFGLIVEKESAA